MELKKNSWGGNQAPSTEADELLELLHGAASEEGYVVKTFKEIGASTSAYGGIEFERNSKKFTLMLSEVFTM